MTMNWKQEIPSGQMMKCTPPQHHQHQHHQRVVLVQEAERKLPDVCQQTETHTHTLCVSVCGVVGVPLSLKQQLNEATMEGLILLPFIRVAARNRCHFLYLSRMPNTHRESPPPPLLLPV